MGIIKEKLINVWVFYNNGKFEKMTQFDFDKINKKQANVKTWMFA